MSKPNQTILKIERIFKKAGLNPGEDETASQMMSEILSIVSQVKQEGHKEGTQDQVRRKKKHGEAMYEKGRQDERSIIQNFLIEEMNIAHTEGTPTSRLTSLHTKIFKLNKK